MRQKVHNLTIIKKLNGGYQIIRSEYVGQQLPYKQASYTQETETVTLFGKKIRSKDAEHMFKAVKAHYQKFYKEFL